MENSKLEVNRRELISLIRAWKINQPVLAQKMGMPIGTFKNKLNEVNGLYSFSDTEFLQLASVADRLMGDIKRFCDRLDIKTDYLI